MDFESVMSNLKKRGYEVSFFNTSRECNEYLNEKIDGMSVGFGGSVTVSQLGLFPLLKEHNRVFNHGDPQQCAAFGSKTVRACAANAQVYISSANAISEDGVIINIDGIGNRIASTAYGHKQVYIIVGKNKFAKDFSQAMYRARNIAAPKNAQRLHMNTPCAEKGDRCYDCNSSQRICRGFLIFERAMLGSTTEIVIVNEDLGY